MDDKILSFSEFLNESIKNNVLTHILDELEPTIEKMSNSIVEKINTKYKEDDRRLLTDYDKEMIKLDLIIDLIKSVEKYTKPNDKLIKLSSNVSIKGNIEINATIQRDGTDYSLFTEAIYAGGYNIQVLHYRYLTKTNLPSTGESTIFKQYREKKKKMNKIERLNNDIKSLEDAIESDTELIKRNKEVTDEQILNDPDKEGENWKVMDITWDEMVRRGADKNYKYDKEFFELEKEKYRKSKLEFWRKIHIDSRIQRIEALKKQLIKLNTKLNQELEKVDILKKIN